MRRPGSRPVVPGPGRVPTEFLAGIEAQDPSPSGCGTVAGRRPCCGPPRPTPRTRAVRGLRLGARRRDPPGRPDGRALPARPPGPV